MPTNEQIDQFIHLTQSIGSRLGRPGAEEWPDVELTMSQLRTLLFLTEGPRRMSEIAANLGSSVSSATSMVERLESKDLVERRHDPDDRRVVMCHLTRYGKRDVERFWRLRQTRIRVLAHLLTAEELDRVVEAMQLVADALARAEHAQRATAIVNEPA
jgi:DNA-binding MarR family transcriptional regulator